MTKPPSWLGSPIRESAEIYLNLGACYFPNPLLLGGLAAFSLSVISRNFFSVAGFFARALSQTYSVALLTNFASYSSLTFLE